MFSVLLGWKKVNGEENSLPNGTMDKTIALPTKADINTIENAERWSLC